MHNLLFTHESIHTSVAIVRSIQLYIFYICMVSKLTLIMLKSFIMI